MARAAFHAIVHGLVQGVFFRASTRDEAARLGLGGWVRNRDDGTVEVHAVGEENALRTLGRGSSAARGERAWTA
jgi:acylphosphatase